MVEIFVLGGLAYLFTKDTRSSSHTTPTKVDTYTKALFCKNHRGSFKVNIEKGIDVKYDNNGQLVANSSVLKCPTCGSKSIGFFVKRK